MEISQTRSDVSSIWNRTQTSSLPTTSCQPFWSPSSNSGLPSQQRLSTSCSWPDKQLWSTWWWTMLPLKASQPWTTYTARLSETWGLQKQSQSTAKKIRRETKSSLLSREEVSSLLLSQLTVITGSISSSWDLCTSGTLWSSLSTKVFTSTFSHTSLCHSVTTFTIGLWSIQVELKIDYNLLFKW